ncbi:hypothetical protein [Pimelobacter simplex]|uniref:hypothetical protein n=1 Tax=Nocardioides simplex TaxID=2045 RepID=UPI0021503109|nr:hypothetical protein [Pimelobacter simplex]UUW91915.1 hypothetical protein M0M43_10665 [Pimelobacter simplex]UUW95742.1 hypothetical protein M0M48_29165 [Pimelobacter simplex]
MTSSTPPHRANRPSDETAADRQAAQQTREQEKKWGDAVPGDRADDPGDDTADDPASDTRSAGRGRG